MKRIQVIVVYLAALLIAGCAKDGETPATGVNQLQVGDAVLPVHIRGNEASSTAVVVLNGGPGESAILMREAIGLYRLESDYRVVYYDQRGCGLTEGQVGASSMTIAHMAEDLHAVVQFVKSQAVAEQIFLVSLDWGAATAVTYLAGAGADPAVKGYVAVNPGFDARLAMERSRDELQQIAGFLLDDNDPENDALAENVLEFYAVNAEINRFNYAEHYRLVEALRGIVLLPDPATAPVDPPQYVQRALEQNERFALENLTFNGGHFLESLDVAEQLDAIAVPVKLIWGAWDRLFPVSLAAEYTGSFGDASTGESLSVFPQSAHRPYLEEGDRFYATVKTWIAIHE